MVGTASRVAATSTPGALSGRPCTGDPSKRSSPPAAVEAWSAPVRTPGSWKVLRTAGNWKVRPRTPKLRGVTPASTAQRLWADLQHAGYLPPQFGSQIFPPDGLFPPDRPPGCTPCCAALSSLAGVIVAVWLACGTGVEVRVALSRARASLQKLRFPARGRHLLQAAAAFAVATWPDEERRDGAAAERARAEHAARDATRRAPRTRGAQRGGEPPRHHRGAVLSPESGARGGGGDGGGGRGDVQPAHGHAAPRHHPRRLRDAPQPRHEREAEDALTQNPRARGAVLGDPGHLRAGHVRAGGGGCQPTLGRRAAVQHLHGGPARGRARAQTPLHAGTVDMPRPRVHTARQRPACVLHAQGHTLRPIGPPSPPACPREAAPPLCC